MNESRHSFALLPRGSAALDAALEAVAALGHLGLMVTPQWPTAEMVEAGARVGNISPEKAISIYRAMIQAAELG